MQTNEQETSQAIFDEIITGMKEWRACHPKATMREIEMEARQPVSKLEAHLIEESALLSQTKEWAGMQSEERPRCANCAEPLVARGKQKRRMQATMGREVEKDANLGHLSHMWDGVFPPSMRN